MVTNVSADRLFCGRRGRCGGSARKPDAARCSSSAAASCWVRFGLVLVLVMAVTGLLAELIAPYSPTANDFGAMMEAPSGRIFWAPTSSGAICSRASSSVRGRP